MPSISIMGCGWLGFPLARRCLELFFEVKGSTTREQKLLQLKSAGITPYLLQYDPQRLQPAHDFYRSQTLFINIPFRRQLPDPDFYYKQIRAVFEEARNGVEKIIFASSTSVYPEANPIATEDSAFEPDNERSAALRKAEELLLNDFKNTTVVRFGGLVGGAREIGKLLAGKKDLSDAQKPVNLIHRDDCIDILLKIVERSLPGEVFNAVCDKHPCREELYVSRARKFGFAPPQFNRERSGTAYKIVSNTKLKERLDYTFRYPDPALFP